MKELVPVHIIAPGPIAGAEKVVISGLQALEQHGIKSFCIIIQEYNAPHFATNFQQVLKTPSVLVVTHKSFDRSLTPQIKELLRNNHATIIHTHGFKALFYGKLANDKYPIVHTHHGDTAHTWKVKLYEWLAYKLMQRIDHVIAVSEKMLHHLATKIPQSKLSLISNMLPITVEEGYQPYTNGEIKLIYVGRLSEEKGLKYFIPHLQASPQCRLSIVGDGPLNSELQEQVKTLNLSNQVNFLGYRTDISKLLIQHHALVLPSLREGLPLTLIEAACSGLAIFAANVGGIPEIVKPLKNGILFSSHQDSEISAAFKKFVTHLPQLTQQSSTLKQSYLQQYSSKNWATKTTTLYNQLLKL